jgi:hypothetical protein
VAWELTSFEPYEPWFHDLLHPDGDPYEYRDIEWIRNFHFASEGEQSDPGAEFTERWDKWRAWKWMAAGPVKGLQIDQGLDIPENGRKIKEASEAGFNALRMKLEYSRWRADSTSFFLHTDTLLHMARSHDMQVMPVLLTDRDALHEGGDLAEFVSCVVRKYGFNPVVSCWELYNHPGASGIAREELESLVRLVFRTARFEFPNQPLTATPLLRVKEFEPGFDYRQQLVHGHRGGWDRIECRGSGDPELCNLVWSLSDVISIDSNLGMPETGWLLSVANRYGRPVLCTDWIPPSEGSVPETLELFSKNKVYWFAGETAPDPSLVKKFRFVQISTPWQ